MGEDVIGALVGELVGEEVGFEVVGSLVGLLEGAELGDEVVGSCKFKDQECKSKMMSKMFEDVFVIISS